jgi:rRNA maturation protein Nop10
MGYLKLIHWLFKKKGERYTIIKCPRCKKDKYFRISEGKPIDKMCYECLQYFTLKIICDHCGKTEDPGLFSFDDIKGPRICSFCYQPYYVTKRNIIQMLR